jgi:hypothetical protein
VRDRKTCAVELAGDVDGEAPVPIGRVDLLDATGRPGDAGVVDEAVEAAERLRGILKQLRDLTPVGDVGLRRVTSGRSSARAPSAPSSTSQTCTLAPSRRKARTISSPIPPAPAVTSTRNPSICRSMMVQPGDAEVRMSLPDEREVPQA